MFQFSYLALFLALCFRTHGKINLPDYDCVRGDQYWNEIFNAFDRNWNETNVQVKLSQDVLVRMTEDMQTMRTQCPLGVTTICIHWYHSHVAAAEKHEQEGDLLHFLNGCMSWGLSKYPISTAAQSRWPVFEILAHFGDKFRAGSHGETAHGCTDPSKQNVVDWSRMKTLLFDWLEYNKLPGQPVNEEFVNNIARLVKDHDLMFAAQVECPLGAAMVCGLQMLSASKRFTMYMNNWQPCVEQMMALTSVKDIHLSGFPMFELLAIFSDLNKDRYNYKYAQSSQDNVKKNKVMSMFLHLPLYPEELEIFDMLPPDARSPISGEVREWLIGQFKRLGRRKTFIDLVGKVIDAAQRSPVAERGFVVADAHREVGELSKSFYLDCGWSGMNSDECRTRGCQFIDGAVNATTPQCRFPEEIYHVFGYSTTITNTNQIAGRRPEVFVTLVYGTKWSRLAIRSALWLQRIGIHNLLIVSLGEEAKQVCENEGREHNVICWAPPTLGGDDKNAQMGMINKAVPISKMKEKNVIMQVVIQLGFDAVYFDLDMFFFKNPTELLHTKYGEADVVLSTHFDGDCVNNGFWAVRSTAIGRRWLQNYLEWFYEHLYEIDGRAVDAFLRYSNIRVSFEPKDLSDVLKTLKFVTLDDGQEFCSTRGGWLGDWDRLQMFHWCAAGDNKLETLTIVHDYALQFPVEVVQSKEQSHLYAGVMKKYEVPNPPPRKQCW